MSTQVHSDADDGDLGFQIAPMIDVVFVLVLFFMVHAGSQIHETHFNVKLPGPAPGLQVSPAVPHFVDITAHGEISLNGALMTVAGSQDFAELSARLYQLRTTSPKDFVIIRPDLDTPHQRVVEVLQAAANAGVTRLTLS